MAWAESIEGGQGGLELLEGSAIYTCLELRIADVQDGFGQPSGLAGCKSEKELRQAFSETTFQPQLQFLATPTLQPQILITQADLGPAERKHVDGHGMIVPNDLCLVTWQEDILSTRRNIFF